MRIGGANAIRLTEAQHSLIEELLLRYQESGAYWGNQRQFKERLAWTLEQVRNGTLYWVLKEGR